MILYVNGDSHAAAAECVNTHAWACDDGLYWGLGQQPHPDNERVSFGCELANWMNAILYLDAQAGGSNARIMRTTREWLDLQTPEVLRDTFVVLQWSTWERQEWQHKGEWLQVNASGTDHVPPELKSRYREFVASIDWRACQAQAHSDIYQFHLELQDRKVAHVMFNGNSHFESEPYHYNWHNCYMSPYDSAQTYDRVLKNNGFSTVNPDSWHFGPDAHCFWAEHVLHYIKANNLLPTQ
jgi:hypothetical protein